MTEKERLESQLYEKMYQENKGFLEEIKRKPAEDIIHHAYEIACRENLLMLFEDETDMTSRQLQTLLEFETPLAELYEDWLSRDTNEMDTFRRSIESCANDVLNRRADEKYSNPAEPMYNKTWEEARACDEHPEWRANHRRNEACARMFQKGASDAYHDQRYPAFLQEWAEAYGRDRCMFVLSCTMARREGDGRFYPPARHEAARFAAQREKMGDRMMSYVNDVHSCIINTAMEHLAKPQHDKEKESILPRNKRPQQSR